MIIAIEVDGVISTPIPNYMALSAVEKCSVLPGAKEAIDKMSALGHRIIIYTSRDASLGPATQIWLQKNKVAYDGIICNKPGTDLIIDTKACKFTDWDSILETNKHMLNNLR